ncbi:MAG: ATP-binding protein [Alphaproteobacteria bacterium]
MNNNRKTSGEKQRGLVKRLMPQTLLGRSLLILVAPVFLIQILSTVIFFDRHWSKMTSRLAYAVAGEIAVIVEVAKMGDIDNVTILAEKNLELLVTYEEGEALKIEDVGVRRSSIGWEAMIKDTMIRELSKAVKNPFLVDVDFNERWVEVRVQMDDGVLNISLPQRRLFSSTSYIFLIWVFCASAILLLIAVLFMRNQIRPIRRLALAAERFGKGRNVQNFKIEGAKEVRQAGQAFLDMKTRIQRQISQRTDMLAGVSHDLRTPLTRLKLQVSMMGDSPDIYDMKRDIQDMEKMIEGYLNFVRGQGRETAQFIDIISLLSEVTVSIKRQGQDVSLNVNGISSLYVSLRATAFKRCIGNIMSNALKYADFIWVTLDHADGGMVALTIEDNGPGIDETLYDEVFRPFYRVDGSRNIETGGVGLGLPIAMDIIHAHGGEIWLDKSAHGGLAVHMRMPA